MPMPCTAPGQSGAILPHLPCRESGRISISLLPSVPFPGRRPSEHDFAITLEVQQGVLRALPITDIQAERDLCLIWRHDSHLPAAAHAFLEVLHAQVPCGKARET